METDEAGPGGLMVLRLWVEPGAALRVRATSTTEPGHRDTAVRYASTKSEVLLVVAAWLDELTPPEPR